MGVTEKVAGAIAKKELGSRERGGGWGESDTIVFITVIRAFNAPK
jgi:hypothetical protein